MQSVTITLSDDMARTIGAKIAAGEFATEGDIVREGLETLLAGDATLEGWLRNDVVASCRERTADPSRGIPGVLWRGRDLTSPLSERG